MERQAVAKLTGKADSKHGRAVCCALLVVVTLLSVTLLRAHFSSPETYRSVYQTIDERQNNVLSLAFGSAIISSAISALPDDMGTALSSEYADFYTGFAVVAGALLLEKYLLTTIGFGFFAIIIPICCGLMILSILSAPYSSTRYSRRQMAKKLFVFGLTLFLMTPASVFISRQIDESYRVSVEQAIDSTEEATGAIEQVKEEESNEGLEEDANPLSMVKEQLDNATSAVGGAVETVGSFAKNILPWAINQLRIYAELFAVMVVTSIVIPLLVPIVAYLMFKILFLSDTDVTFPAPLVEALVSGGSTLSSISGSQPGKLPDAGGGLGPDVMHSAMGGGVAPEPDSVTAEPDAATGDGQDA